MNEVQKKRNGGPLTSQLHHRPRNAVIAALEHRPHLGRLLSRKRHAVTVHIVTKVPKLTDLFHS